MTRRCLSKGAAVFKNDSQLIMQDVIQGALALRTVRRPHTHLSTAVVFSSLSDVLATECQRRATMMQSWQPFSVKFTTS